MTVWTTLNSIKVCCRIKLVNFPFFGFSTHHDVSFLKETLKLNLNQRQQGGFHLTQIVSSPLATGIDIARGFSPWWHWS
jgi:hypothetical protein